VTDLYVVFVFLRAGWLVAHKLSEDGARIGEGYDRGGRTANACIGDKLPGKTSS
jgi:hypothetical protein